jgi:hypothetical protein
MEKRYETFAEFYPFYLSEHKHPISRRLHFIGTGLVFVLLLFALLYGHWWLWLGIPLVGYGFAWVGHYFFERNKPATFQYPLYSLRSDFKLFFEILSGKQKL